MTDRDNRPYFDSLTMDIATIAEKNWSDIKALQDIRF